MAPQHLTDYKATTQVCVCIKSYLCKFSKKVTFYYIIFFELFIILPGFIYLFISVRIRHTLLFTTPCVLPKLHDNLQFLQPYPLF